MDCVTAVEDCVTAVDVDSVKDLSAMDCVTAVLDTCFRKCKISLPWTMSQL